MLRRTLLLCLLAALLAPLAATGATRVYYRLPLNDRAVVAPKTIPFNDLDLTRINWTGWGKSTATGRARASVRVSPSRRVTGRATLRMFKRHREGRRTFYGCMTGRIRGSGVPAELTRIVWPPGCSR